jgi:hypothetical protein
MLNYFNVIREKSSTLVIKKTKVLTRKKQQGFTLITVLVLSSLASILVLNSLKDNVNQERLSGNFQKKINSRLISERGIFDSIAVAQTFLSANQSATIADLTNNLGTQTGNKTLTHGGMSYEVVSSETTPGELLLSSKGTRFEGESALKVRLRVTPGGSNSPFADAVVGCDGVNLSGSGQIDSYNSNVAPYDSHNPGNEGNVSTITKSDSSAVPPVSSDIILGGNSPILGDVSSAGGINTKTSRVEGSLHANGDIIIGSGSGVKVTGNVRTRGNYYQNGGKIGGYVRANGDALMVWTTFILNNAHSGLDILYGGSPDFKDTTNNQFYAENQYNVFPDVAKVKDSDVNAPDYDATNPATNCDHLNVASKIAIVANGASSLPSLGTLSTSTFTFTENKVLGSAEGHYTIHGDNTVFSSVNENVLGETLPVIKLANLYLSSDANAVITGDVTLYIEGDFTLTGGAKMTITAGSSLTLLIQGKVKIAAGAKIEALQHGLTLARVGREARPVMSIYSSYASTVRRGNRYDDYGFQVSGAGELYAAIYAPLAFADIGAGTTLYGSIRAKRVQVTGGSAMHYDAALGDGDRGGSYSTNAILSFLGFEY